MDTLNEGIELTHVDGGKMIPKDKHISRKNTAWLLLCFALLVVGAIVGANIYVDYLQTGEWEQERLLTQNKVIRENIIKNLESTNDALTILQQQVIQGNINQRLNEYLTLLAEAMPGVRTLHIINAQGDTIASSIPETLVGKNFKYRAYFQTPRQHPDPGMLYISQPFTTVTGFYVIAVSRMIPDRDGGFAGVVVATLDPGYFKTLLASVLYAQDMWSAVIHQDGELFMLSPDKPGVAGMNQNVPGKFFAKYRASGLTMSIYTGRLHATGKDGVLALSTVQDDRLKLDKPLVVATSRNLADIYQSWRHVSIIQVVLFCLGSLIAIVALFFSQKRHREHEQFAAQSVVALAESAERLKLATRAAGLGIWDWDPVKNEAVWDDGMYPLYGVDRETFSVTFDSWLNMLHPDDRTRIQERVALALQGKKEYEIDYRVVLPDGLTRIMRTVGEVIRDNDGKALRMIGTTEDITDKKRLEGQLLQAQRIESVGRLAGGVAHDFNNMLGVILGHAELGLLHLDPAHPACASLAEIRKAAERSAALTRQLLAFARKQEVQPTVLDLNEAVTALLKMLQRLIGEDILLAWQLGPELWQVKMDQSQIDQILVNLCVNARDAIKDTGRITIETKNIIIDADYCAAHLEAAPGEYVRLTVSDDGAGMDKQTLTHIFEPFYTTKELGKGTGLGLATVYGAVKQNNGFISIYSEPGQGSTFSIYLPRHAGGSGQVQAEYAEVPAPRGQETILLVEDEAAILEIATRILEKQGYTVLAASTPGEAIRLAREHAGEIHMFMTDVIMPEMNGLDLSKNLLAIYPHMKGLFMSGYTADIIASHGVLEEGVHFIQKPFSLPNLAVKVREVLDS
jgi:signal transduction histidine kinase